MAFHTLNRKLFTLEQWCIGWAPATIEQFLSDPARVNFSWLKPRSNREFLADPFGVEVDGRLTIFAEKLVWGGHKGQIVKIEVGGAAAPTQTVIADACHASYPFVVRDGATAYMVPEISERGDLTFYQMDKDRLGAPAARIPSFAAIDPTFLFHEGTWWLFCTHPQADNRELNLYFSDRLFGPYQPHPQNPVVADPSCARPAGGIIESAGGLLRPAQDCSQTYGGAVALCQIEVLTRHEYRERVVRRLAPDLLAGGFAAGFHTLSHTENFVLVDTKRYARHPLATPIKLCHRVRFP